MARREAVTEFGDGGIIVGQLLHERQCLAIGELGLRRLVRIKQEHADTFDRLRQIVPGFVCRPAGRGRRLLVGPCQAVLRQGVGVLARLGQEVAELRPAEC